VWCRAHSIQHIRSMYDVRRNLRSLVFRVEKKGFLWCYWKFWLRTRNRPCVRVAGNEWWMKLNQSPNLVSFKYLKEVQIALHWFWQNLYNGLVAGSRLGWVWLNSKVKKTQNMFVGTVEIVFFFHTQIYVVEINEEEDTFLYQWLSQVSFIKVFSWWWPIYKRVHIF